MPIKIVVEDVVDAVVGAASGVVEASENAGELEVAEKIEKLSTSSQDKYITSAHDFKYLPRTLS